MYFTPALILVQLAISVSALGLRDSTDDSAAKLGNETAAGVVNGTAPFQINGTVPSILNDTVPAFFNITSPLPLNITSPALFNDTTNTVMSFSQEGAFNGIVGSLIEAHDAITASDSSNSLFTDASDVWHSLYEAAPYWTSKDDVDIVAALDAQREAVYSLGENDQGFSPEIRDNIRGLLLNHLLLVGFLDELYGQAETPEYIKIYSGIIIGALIHFLAVDVGQIY